MLGYPGQRSDSYKKVIVGLQARPTIEGSQPLRHMVASSTRKMVYCWCQTRWQLNSSAKEVDLSAAKEPLISQITDQVQTLPQDLRQQVLDYIEYLHTKYVSDRNIERDQALEATFGSWKTIVNQSRSCKISMHSAPSLNQRPTCDVPLGYRHVCLLAQRKSQRQDPAPGHRMGPGCHLCDHTGRSRLSLSVNRERAVARAPLWHNL